RLVRGVLGEAALKSRLPDERDDEIQRLPAKVGEITMNNELFRSSSDSCCSAAGSARVLTIESAAPSSSSRRDTASMSAVAGCHAERFAHDRSRTRGRFGRRVNGTREPRDVALARGRAWPM